MGQVLNAFESYQLGVVSTVSVFKMKDRIISPSAWLGRQTEALVWAMSVGC